MSQSKSQSQQNSKPEDRVLNQYLNTLPQIKQCVHSISLTLGPVEKVHPTKAVFSPQLGILTYHSQESSTSHPPYIEEVDCASLESVLWILGLNDVRQDLVIEIIPFMDTRPFMTSKTFASLRNHFKVS